MKVLELQISVAESAELIEGKVLNGDCTAEEIGTWSNHLKESQEESHE